ncbi:response regulator [Bacteriovorax sp. Seq25_V]|uniref:response regulator n=1 Tax=Bacteriovorax sp. Seq25_V TaxID=1201288 RepID=UPI000389EE8B|nr:response regulator [Bacteriovorax sp. Seq25_V]EQC45305.1 response regulator receiver domain protein [Bacteriovorax sp. Seq25_V]
MNFEILDSLFEPIVIVNKDNEIIYYNHMFSTFTKSSPRVIKNKKFLKEIIAENFISTLIDQTFETKSNTISKEELIDSLQDQELHVIAKGTYLLDKDLVLVSLNDITIEKNLYQKYRYQIEELKEIHHQIVQADKLTTIGEITASISHEISNPLTIASGTLELIKALFESEDINSQKELLDSCLNDVIESFMRINSIIKGMKKFLHGNEDKKEYVSVEEIIENSTRLVNSQLKKSQVSMEVKNNTESKESIVFVNSLKMEQLFINLIKNSIDSINSIPNNESRSIGITLDETEMCYEVQLCDTGAGIPTEIQDKIFESFFTTKEVGEGTGLGLAIATKIIESYQGTLELVSASSPTIFKITIPKMSTLSIASSTLNRDNAQELNLNILVIDDEVKILNLFNESISDSNVNVICASNPKEALALIDDGRFNMIFIDFSMPEMNGDELAKKIRELSYSGPIIYLTGKVADEKIKSDIASGLFNDHLQKPFIKDDIVNMMNKWKEGEK